MSGTSYTSSDFDTNYPVGMQNYYWTYARNRILLRELRKAGLADKKILEIGCATGLVIRHLRGNGLQVWGSELGDPNVLSEVKEYVFTRQNCNDLPQEFRDSVQVLMLLDVIEHIEEPIPFLQAILARYPNATDIVISVPARAELWSSYDVEYRHFRRYDAAMMRETVAALPYRIHKMAYLFTCLYPPAWLAAKTSGKRNHVVQPPRTPFMIFVHRVLAWVLYMDYLLVPGAVPGSSILAFLKQDSQRR